MQQVAVNLSIGYDNRQMRSVNGPPGTGKTTLLKDIFAELVVQQAYEITKLEEPRMKGAPSTVYYQRASMGYLPEKIAEKNIVVASSNNGAVQNIVNELPLSDGIDKNLLPELLKTDYFTEIANSQEEQNDEETEVPKNWGMFSLEGGKSANMTKLLSIVEAMVNEMKKDSFKEDPGVYKRFQEQYHQIERVRAQRQREADRVMAGDFSAAENHSWKALDMMKEYDDLQLSNPWFDREFRIMQSRLFILALQVRRQFLYDNYKNLNAARIIWNNPSKYLEEGKEYLIPAAWNWLNFAIPVISSTFASFSRMCANLKENTLGHLFVDEAGQALPQASVGAIFRSRHVMVVGDPSQIKPVLTLDQGVLGLLSRHYGVSDIYLSEDASTQTLVDYASRYGFFKDRDKGEDSWIGIPLWVHRRCLYPMFTISNAISYNGLMVQGNKKDLGKTGWYDIKGTANNKYVKEQSEFLVDLLKKMMEEDPAAKDKIYIITPFSNVAYRLAMDLDKIGFTKRDSSRKPTNIGTIHTFQGKEAAIVFMVLGADTRSTGAANWAVNEPNMMNVAATRAKKEFYLIGDRKMYKGLGSEVIKNTDQIICDYGKEHPELVRWETQLPKKEPEKQPQTLEKEPERQWQVLKKEKAAERQPQTFEMTGTVKTVGKKVNTSYAYIEGDDKVTYVIGEDIYKNIENADSFIKKGGRISFILANVKKVGERVYLKDPSGIRPCSQEHGKKQNSSK